MTKRLLQFSEWLFPGFHVGRFIQFMKNFREKKIIEIGKKTVKLIFENFRNKLDRLKPSLIFEDQAETRTDF